MLLKGFIFSCNLSSAGVSDTVAVWAITGDSYATRMILFANRKAKEFSVYPLGGTTKVNISMAHEGANIVKDYVRKKLFLKSGFSFI